jgi:hypothetical protein
MKKNLLSTIALWAIVILFLVNLLVTVLDPKTASAQKDSSLSLIGRYQISSWALSTGGTSHYTGYYVIDTTTGKLLNKASEVHKQGEIDVPPN